MQILYKKFGALLTMLPPLSQGKLIIHQEFFLTRGFKNVYCICFVSYKTNETFLLNSGSHLIKSYSKLKINQNFVILPFTLQKGTGKYHIDNRRKNLR